MSNEVEVLNPETGVTEAESTASSTLGVSVDSRTYRTYGTLDAEGKPTEKFVRAQTADGKGWSTLEEKGLTRLSENTFLFQTLEDINAFSDLIPDEDQRLYVIQRGIDSIQTAKANAMQTDFDGAKLTFKYDGQTVDLREAINEAPKRQSLTSVQKITRDVSALDPAEAQKLVAALMAQLAAQGISAPSM